MKYFIQLMILAAFVVLSCKDVQSPEPLLDEVFETAEETFEDIEVLDKPTILVHFIDPIGFEQLVTKQGDVAETILDDMMWYDHEMSRKADSLEIPVISSNQRVLKANYDGSVFEHIQDTSSGFVSYYYFDGNAIKAYDILEMIELLKRK